MALKYVVKKTTFGFDDTKAEKYTNQLYTECFGFLCVV